ncbi:MAG: hypothetical protein JSW00_08635 [Thermoplasmata archaeon]|nr:MAG: hypothetical protein JSW00_08635 [Thermoplasmata archaeon]
MNYRFVSISIIWFMIIGGFFGFVNLKSENVKAETWNIEIPDPADDVGMYNSIAMDSSGFPHISYFDNASEDLKYVKWTGSNWKVETVESAGDIGYFSSLAVDSNDIPHISYYDQTNGDLKYAKWSGSKWNIETVDSEKDVGQFSSLALDSSDHPHISYYDNTSLDLKYTEWTGSKWDIETVDSQGDVGFYISIAVDENDNPHIGYTANESWDVRYAKRTQSNWDTEIVHSPQYVSHAGSLTLDSNGDPHMSYFDFFVDSMNGVYYFNVMYAVREAGVWSSETIATTKFSGFSGSIALDSDDNPTICYSWGDINNDNFETNELRYQKYNGSRWIEETVDSSKNIGLYSSIAMDSKDYLHISYYDENERTLKCAIPQKPPNKPDKPQGPESGDVDKTYSYSVSALDPNDDQVKYRIDWDDGNTSETDYVNSGTTDSLSHNWSSQGTYNITVCAIDIHGDSSEWSDEFTVVISAQEEPDEGDGGDGADEEGLPLLLLSGIIGIIVALAIASTLVLYKRSKAAKGPTPTYPIQQYPQQTSSSLPGQTTPIQPQTQTLQVTCPSCHNIFFMVTKPGPQKVQCPKCGTQGVMK